MKRFLILLLALAMLTGLAACGEVKQAEVVENVEPEKNTIVIETPPAMVNGPQASQAPVSTYAPVSILPTTAPSATPGPVAITTPEPSAPSPSPSAAPEGGNGQSGGSSQEKPFEYADDSGKDYNATATQEEKNNAVWGYITGQGVNFRVGPGKEYKIYESLAKGTRLKILGTANAEWVKVWYNDYLIGYVSGDYISVGTPGQDASIVTPSPEPSTAPADDSGSDAVIISP